MLDVRCEEGGQKLFSLFPLPHARNKTLASTSAVWLLALVGVDQKYHHKHMDITWILEKWRREKNYYQA
jgi:hypothetical protein